LAASNMSKPEAKDVVTPEAGGIYHWKYSVCKHFVVYRESCNMTEVGAHSLCKVSNLALFQLFIISYGPLIYNSWAVVMCLISIVYLLRSRNVNDTVFVVIKDTVDEFLLVEIK
jgi:hypothetical protein